MNNKELYALILHLEKFSLDSLQDLIADLKNIENIKSKSKKCQIRDKLESLMSAEGAGGLIVEGSSLPQIAQKILIIINPHYM